MLPQSVRLLFIIVIICKLGSADDVCEARFDIKSSLSQSDCPPDTSTHKHYVFDGKYKQQCFPYCQKILIGMELVGKSCANQLCPPAYNCEGEDDRAKCVFDDSSCMKYHVNYAKKNNDVPFFKAFWKPECLPDGTWAPKQCKGDKFTGRCFCYNAVGLRIDGQQWANKEENMTCACSRRRYEMVQTTANFYSSLHCDGEGNYEPLQCNDGQCWCAHPPTGKVLTKVVPEHMMKFLPCYDKKINGDQYMRQCESKLFAQQKIVKKLHIHGTTEFLYNSFFCDADGTYGKLKISENMARCVWKDNVQIGSSAAELKDIEGMTCNCARDLKYYELAGRDPEDRGVCSGNGNYEPIQMKILDDGSFRYFCVDSDGFQKSPLVEDRTKLNCLTYK